MSRTRCLIGAGRRLAVLAVTALSLTVLPPAPAQAAPPPAAVITVNYQDFTPAAKAAFQRAVDRWERFLTSGVTITVRASYVDQGPNALGHAGPSAVVDRPGLKPGRWYPTALANAMTGTDQIPGHPDIQAEMNSGRTNWWFGTGAPPAGKIDFESVVMHELGHGVGFGGWLMKKPTGKGGYYYSYPGVYDDFTEAASGKKLLSYPNNSTALGSQLTSGALYWGGNYGVAFNGGDRPRLYAPKTWEPGSSYQHLNEKTYPGSTRNSLMTPHLSANQVSRQPGAITLGFLRDIGWELGPAGETLVNRLTVVGISASDTTPSAGQTVTMTGRLRRAVDNTALAGRTLDLYRRRVGTTSWTKTCSKTTTATGTATCSVTPTADLQLEWRHPRTSSTDADTSKRVTLNVP